MNIYCRYKLTCESVDGSGNFKITKFFEVKTGKCSKFIFLTLFSMHAKDQKAYPFSSNT